MRRAKCMCLCTTSACVYVCMCGNVSTLCHSAMYLCPFVQLMATSMRCQYDYDSSERHRGSPAHARTHLVLESSIAEKQSSKHVWSARMCVHVRAHAPTRSPATAFARLRGVCQAAGDRPRWGGVQAESWTSSSSAFRRAGRPPARRRSWPHARKVQGHSTILRMTDHSRCRVQVSHRASAIAREHGPALRPGLGWAIVEQLPVAALARLADIFGHIRPCSGHVARRPACDNPQARRRHGWRAAQGTAPSSRRPTACGPPVVDWTTRSAVFHFARLHAY